MQFVTIVEHQMTIRAQYVVGKADNAIQQAVVVQKVVNAIQQINHYPLQSAIFIIGFPNTYPLDSELSSG